jgi:type II secretory pathway component GspD/PulD (secretin)
MVLQANKWGWKALAARMLLAPVLAGSLAVPAFAQQPASKTTPATQQQQTQDPTALLKLGRQALGEGKLEAAAGYARQADAANPSGKWGLISDTPAALLKDTHLARQKADKALAAQLTTEARELVKRGGKTDAEKLTNLDAAAAKLDKAVTLAGKGDLFDGINVFADKPDALKKEVDTARAALRKSNPGLVTADVRGTAPDRKPLADMAKPLPTGGVGSGVRPAKFELEQPTGTTVPGSVTGAKKAQAAEMVVAGRKLMVEGKLAEARAKFADASTMGVTFGFSEDSPEKGMQDVAARGKAKVDGLVTAAKGFSEKKEWTKADLALTDAMSMAVSLDLWTREIDIELEALKKAMGQVKADVAKTNAADMPLPALPKLDAPKGIDLPKTPELPKGIDLPKTAELPKTVDTPKPVEVDLPGLELPSEPKGEKPALPDVPKADKPMPAVGLPTVPVIKPEPKGEVKAEEPTAAKKKADEGKKLLDQAADLLKKGEHDMAMKLAVQVHNGEFGLKEDAQKLMVAVDTERKVAKTKETVQAFTAATEAVGMKQYAYADRLLAQIDDSSLPADKQAEAKKVREKVAEELTAAKAAVAPPVEPAKPTAGNLIPSTPATGAIDQAKSVVEAEAQQLRSESLQVQARALKLFEQGDTDQAVQLLADLATKVKASKLTPARQRTILEPIEAKLDNFRLIKRQVDLYTKDVKEKKDRIEGRLAKASAEQQRQEEIAKRVGDIRELMDKKNFADAEKLALQAKQLDPDNPTLNLIYDLAKRNRRMDDANRLKANNEQATLDLLNQGDDYGSNVPLNGDPIRLSMTRALQNRGRPSGDDVYSRPRTGVEREIEMKLDKAMKVNFKQATLREVIDKFAETAQINLSVDEPAMAAAGIEMDKVLVSENIVQPISMRSIMQVILEKNQLQYLVENDMVVVTTLKKAKGRMYTKVFSVTELVTPIPDFAIPESQSLEKTLQRVATPTQPWVDAAAAAKSAFGSGGQLVSDRAGFMPSGGFGGGSLQNTPTGSGNHVVGASTTVAPSKANHSEQLMKLVKGMVRPHTWDEQGGAGRLAYYDIGGALVVNQTADVITEVNNLLESLRRLQDLSVSVEVRLISLSEAFFERIGVDFQMNMKTNGKTQGFEPSLTTGQFRPAPFINDISAKGVVTGWNPNQGGFTPDLDIPIRPNSYGFSAPPFGNYPGNGNGGLNLGLAFLNDIQVFMFLEAAAGDRRSNIMQAPKITCFNGQFATVSVTTQQFFVLGLQVFNVGGQFVYLPQNTAVPLGVTLGVQPVVSSDRRFVRLTLPLQFTDQVPDATVPLFPVTAFITPVFEGGSQGTPIPFTQFFQQPSFTTISVNTTVVVPDGGTVVLGGLKTMSEGRNEFGPPVLSQVPYLNRLFKNTGVGRDTRHLMLMVTPRIIITSEEEALATGTGVGLGTGN